VIFYQNKFKYQDNLHVLIFYQAKATSFITPSGLFLKKYYTCRLSKKGSILRCKFTTLPLSMCVGIFCPVRAPLARHPAQSGSTPYHVSSRSLGMLYTSELSSLCRVQTCFISLNALCPKSSMYNRF
jgi:hypothetical protein